MPPYTDPVSVSDHRRGSERSDHTGSRPHLPGQKHHGDPGQWRLKTDHVSVGLFNLSGVMMFYFILFAPPLLVPGHVPERRRCDRFVLRVVEESESRQLRSTHLQIRARLQLPPAQ